MKASTKCIGNMFVIIVTVWSFCLRVMVLLVRSNARDTKRRTAAWTTQTRNNTMKTSCAPDNVYCILNNFDAASLTLGHLFVAWVVVCCFAAYFITKKGWTYVYYLHLFRTCSCDIQDCRQWDTPQRDGISPQVSRTIRTRHWKARMV